MKKIKWVLIGLVLLLTSCEHIVFDSTKEVNVIYKEVWSGLPEKFNSFKDWVYGVSYIINDGYPSDTGYSLGARDHEFYIDMFVPLAEPISYFKFNYYLKARYNTESGNNSGCYGFRVDTNVGSSVFINNYKGINGNWNFYSEDLLFVINDILNKGGKGWKDLKYIHLVFNDTCIMLGENVFLIVDNISINMY